ncbi:MAG: hypothetical protein AAFZ91_09675 [Pseudomonadota bacterium]
MTDLTVITPPVGEPVSLSQAKDFLRIGHDGEDVLIGDLIHRARERVEQASGLALGMRTLQLKWTTWPVGLSGRGARLSPGPVKTLSAVRIADAEGGLIDHTARFQLSCGRVCLRPSSMVPGIPIGGHVEVEFQAGFDDIPDDLQEAVLRLVGQAYATRTPSAFEFSLDEGALSPEVRGILAARRELRL